MTWRIKTKKKKKKKKKKSIGYSDNIQDNGGTNNIGVKLAHTDFLKRHREKSNKEVFQLMNMRPNLQCTPREMLLKMLSR